MKTRRHANATPSAHRAAAALVVALLGALPTPLGAVSTASFETAVGTDIPDADASGLVSAVVVDTAIETVADVNVTVTVSGEFNGDLYGYLTHGDGFAVLLNRPGRRLEALEGYGDDGLAVTFDDGAANGDIHTYRLALTGDHALPVVGEKATAGTFAPDGRAVDPDHVLDTDPRTAMLSSFDGLDPDGSWTLFLADLSAGGVSTLESWTLELTGPTPFDTWRAANFDAGELAVDAVSGAGADPDRDGLTNLVEYALGLAPKAPSFTGRPASAHDDATGFLTLTVDRSAAATDVVFRVQVSGDLVDWHPADDSETGFTTVVSDTSDRLVVRDNTPTAPGVYRFIRLRVER